MQNSSDNSLAWVLDQINERLSVGKVDDGHELFLAIEETKLDDVVIKSLEERYAELLAAADAAKPPPTTDEEDDIYSSGPDSSAVRNPSSLTPNASQIVEDREREKELDETIKLLQFSNSARNILESFVPVTYSSPVTGKYFGLLKEIIIVSRICQIHAVIF